MQPAGRITDISGRDLLFSRDFTAGEFESRRRQIAQAIGAGACLLVPSAPPVPGDVPVQDAVFYYFCGLETCHAYLLVEGGSGRSTVFLPSRDAMEGLPEDKLGFEDADLIKQRLSVAAVVSSAELATALGGAKVIFTPHAEVEGGGATRFGANGCANRRENEPWDQAEPRHKRFIRLLRERHPGVGVEDACPLVNRMRTIKSPAEIAVLRQAGALAAAAVTEGMKATRPGMNENRLQAIAEYVLRDRGHCGLGYGVIAAGGKRTWNGHYHFNNATLREDEIVLMDCGPDLRHYSSDMARMWPANGVFGAWHRRVYGFIVEYHKALLSLVRPGILPADVYAEAAARMARLCSDRSAPYADMKPVFDGMVAAGVRYLNHGVGLSVHDAIDGAWRNEPLREGFVCALDPMAWCEPQHEYIRVEDTIVVTADGCERLTGGTPFEIDEVEALMRTGSRFAD